MHKKTHVPYYESNLTMLLQPALGGQSHTTVIVCASPDDDDADETLHALRFGERCRQVTTGARTSSTAVMSTVLHAIDQEIASLRQEIEALRSVGAAAKAEAELNDKSLRGAGYGHGASRVKAQKHADGSGGGEESVLGGTQKNASTGAYTFVDDSAGAYLNASTRLEGLIARKREITGTDV